MSVLRLLTAFALVIGMAAVPCAVDAQSSPVQVDPSEPETRLGDIVVEGTKIEELARRFVEQAARPVTGRGLARWTAPVCVGVVNFKHDLAQSIADRVSTLASNFDISIADAPCTPNLLIVGTLDGSSLATAWVKRRPTDFRWNVSGSHDLPSALARFTTSQDPVRWWQLSIPTYFDIFTGNATPAVRMPGRPAPSIVVYAKSQIMGRTRDDLKRSVVIVDVTRVETITTEQLCDYLAMVSFAQVDPGADMSGFDSILNVFDNPSMSQGMTRWDQAYLRALYSADETYRLNPNEQAEGLAETLRVSQRTSTTSH